MKIERVGSQASAKGRQIGSQVRFESIRSFRHLIRRNIQSRLALGIYIFDCNHGASAQALNTIL
jgi:hypothetical protein